MRLKTGPASPGEITLLFYEGSADASNVAVGNKNSGEGWADRCRQACDSGFRKSGRARGGWKGKGKREREKILFQPACRLVSAAGCIRDGGDLFGGCVATEAQKKRDFRMPWGCCSRPPGLIPCTLPLKKAEEGKALTICVESIDGFGGGRRGKHAGAERSRRKKESMTEMAGDALV